MIKKILALGIVGLSLVACNNETKKEGAKGNSTEKSAENKTDEQPAPAVEIKPAISDSAGVFTQKFVLEKGQTYPLTTITKNVQSITDPSGKSMKMSSESSDEMSVTVEDFKDGVYDVKVNLIGKRTSETANGQSIVVDTKAAAPKEENLKMMWSVNKALVGHSLQMKMKENGEVISLAGFEPIYKKVETAATQIKDAQQRNAFITGFKQSFGEKSLKEQFSKNFLVLPKKGVKVGEKWTETENATPDGKVKMTTTFTLKSVENGVVTIVVSGGIPKKSDKQSQQGLTHSVSSELSQNGTMTLDQKSGWVKTQSVTIKTIQEESITDGKQSQSMKSVGTSTISVNP